MNEKDDAEGKNISPSLISDAEVAMLSQLRQRVWEMNKPEDIENVAELLRDGLGRLGFAFWDYGLNVIDETAELPVLRIVHHRGADGTSWQIRRFRRSEDLQRLSAANV
ncbi:MAG: hypothetical protein ACI8P2_004593 [Candidatus Latescibacterota bacterium]|jgi:hypothetical protein